MKGKFWDLQARANDAELYIYDVIGDDMWGESVSAKSLISALADIGSVENLSVRINSPGGSVSDGVAIYNALIRNSARVTVNIDGMALSIASIIAMAGNTISMAENALMMIHDPWTYMAGNAADMRKMADTLDKAKAGMLATYAGRTGKDESEISDLMTAETWFTAAEAVEAGFADIVDAPVKMAACFDLSMYRNAPEIIKAGRKIANAKRKLEVITI